MPAQSPGTQLRTLLRGSERLAGPLRKKAGSSFPDYDGDKSLAAHHLARAAERAPGYPGLSRRAFAAALKGITMDFSYSPKVQELQARVRDFIDRYVLPFAPEYQREISRQVRRPVEPVPARTQAG